MPSILIKRGTRTQIESAKTASGLNAGEPYLITDESRLAIGTSVNTYSDFAKKSEVADLQAALDSKASLSDCLAYAIILGG